MVDGFKPGQRKILFSCFKRKLKDEIKVAQLAGYAMPPGCGDSWRSVRYPNLDSCALQ
jgi:hypothetical protein